MAGSLCGKTGADGVQVKPLDNLSPAERSAVSSQLVALLAAGCAEELRFTDRGADLVELGCRDLQQDILSGASGWFVAWHGGEPVGVVRLASAGSSTPDASVIAGLYVQPEWRRLGVGRRLLLAAAIAAKALGKQRVFIYVARRNPARSFYAKLGLGPGIEAGMPGFLRLEWPVNSKVELNANSTKEVKHVSDKKWTPFVLKAIAVAMGVASVVLSIIQPSQIERMVLLLGVGLASLAISTLND